MTTEAQHAPMTADEERRETLRLLAEISKSLKHQRHLDDTIQLSASKPWIVDYRDYTHIYLFSSRSQVLTIEEYGTFLLYAGVWIQFDLAAGMRVFAQGQTNLVPLNIRFSNQVIAHPPVPATMGAALATPAGNPTQTAAAAADTLYKFGSDGLTTAFHISIQNNTGANVLYAFDQDSTKSGNAVYTLATGNIIFWDRETQILHFNSAAQQSFGGTTGITVEAFA